MYRLPSSRCFHKKKLTVNLDDLIDSVGYVLNFSDPDVLY